MVAHLAIERVSEKTLLLVDFNGRETDEKAPKSCRSSMRKQLSVDKFKPVNQLVEPLSASLDTRSDKHGNFRERDIYDRSN